MHVVKSVGVLSVGKIMGLIYGCMGLIFVPIFLIAGLIGSFAGNRPAAFTGVIGIVIAFLMPVLYGVIGFVVGAIGTALYNLMANWAGGIEIHLGPSPQVQSAAYPVPHSPSS